MEAAAIAYREAVILDKNDIEAQLGLATALEACGKRKDSQLAREIEIALPIELDHHAQISLVERFVYSQYSR